MCPLLAKRERTLHPGGGSCKAGEPGGLPLPTVPYFWAVVSKPGYALESPMGPVLLFGQHFFFFCLFAFPRVAPVACGGSQARGRIGAVAAGLRYVGSEPRLQPAMLDPQPTEQDQGSNLKPHGS